MRKAWTWAAVAVVAAVLVGCGGKGGAGGGASGPVGTWVLDIEKAVDMAVEEANKKLAEMSAEERKMAEGMMKPEAIRGMLKGMLGNMKIELELRADKTAKMTASGMPGQEAEELLGTWEQKGDSIVVTPKTKAGKPVEGGDAKEATMKLKGDLLLMETGEGGPSIALKRK